MERVWVCHIIHENDLVCFAKQVEGDFFKDVLTSNIYNVKFHRAVTSSLRLDFLELVLAALSHHVVVVKVVVKRLVDDLGFTDSWFSRNNHPRSKS